MTPGSDESPGQPSVPSVAAAFTILRTLRTSDTPLTLAELARATGLPKSSTHRLTATLLEQRVLLRETSTGRYSLGPDLVELARGFVEGDTRRDFHVVAEAVVAEIDQTVQLAILTAPDVTFVAYVDCSRPVRLATRVGRRLPAHATAAGKAILAFCPEEQVQQVVDAGLATVTSRTIVDAATFRGELAEVRGRGWALEAEESTPNLCCVAAPVFGDGERLFGAFTVCVAARTLPASRVEHYARLAVSAAHQISGRATASEAGAQAGGGSR